jgi:hypothetical protein
MNSPQLERGLPLVLGITGHRDLVQEDIPVLRARIEELITQLRRQYPHTPLRLLSSLAEGADRLVAQVAIDMDVELVAPLPLDEEEYARDFPDSLDEFKRLRDQASAQVDSYVFPVPLVYGYTREAVCEYGPARDHQYAAVGAYIAQQCHILIALWDGEPSDKVGGTHHTLRFKLEGVPEPYAKQINPLDRPDIGQVYHIPTRRRQNMDIPLWRGEATQGRWLHPAGHDESYYQRIYGYIDGFNHDSRSVSDKHLRRSRGYVLPDDAPLNPQQNRILNVYAFADHMAVGFQAITRRFLAAIFVLAGMMALSFETYAHLIVKRPVLVMYLLCFIGIAGLYTWSRKLRAQSRYLDYRALAEGLRVQLFWRLAGIKQNVSFHYLQKQNDELQWIREAIRGINSVIPQGQPRYDLVHDHWIKDQSDYFIRSANRDHCQMERLDKIADLLYGLGLTLSVLVIIFWDYLEHAVGLHHLLIVIMGFLPVVAALWIAYAEKTALREQSKQYARMALIFKRVREQIEAIGLTTDDSGRNRQLDCLIVELGKEALIENGDWVLLHRERPIEIPKG